MSSASVVIPVYNGAKHLAETLDTIYVQTDPPGEVVIADDCSTDNSIAIAKSHPVVTRVVQSNSNQGVCHARNLAIEATTGDLICFCDQDDLWAPNKLERQVDIVAQNPIIDFLFTDFRHQRGNDLDQTTKFDQAPVGWWDEVVASRDHALAILVHPSLPHLLTFQPAFPSTIMIRRSLLERSGLFDKTLGREQSEDLEFLLRCDSTGRIGALAEPLVTIRKHAGNYSKDNLKTTLSQIRILHAMLEPEGRYMAFRPEIDRQLKQRSVNVINSAFAAGDLKMCWRMAQEFPDHSREFKLWLKIVIASLPSSIGQRLQAMTVRQGR